jgi:AbiV family abortive infection protein
MTISHDEELAFLRSVQEEDKADPLSPSLETILQNARRLLDDARLLYDNERFASATALAILAMEETGKYFIVKRASEKDSVAKDLNNHIEKQIHFASYPFVETILIEFFKRLGFVPKLGAQMPEQQRQWMNSESGQTFLKKFLDNKDFMDSFVQGVLDTDNGSFMARAERKELNKLKQRCMYVDLDETSQVLADPADITQETANFFLRLAHRIIGRYARHDA